MSEIIKQSFLLMVKKIITLKEKINMLNKECDRLLEENADLAHKCKNIKNSFSKQNFIFSHTKIINIINEINYALAINDNIKIELYINEITYEYKTAKTHVTYLTELINDIEMDNIRLVNLINGTKGVAKVNVDLVKKFDVPWKQILSGLGIGAAVITGLGLTGLGLYEGIKKITENKLKTIIDSYVMQIKKNFFVDSLEEIERKQYDDDILSEISLNPLNSYEYNAMVIIGMGGESGVNLLDKIDKKMRTGILAHIEELILEQSIRDTQINNLKEIKNIEIMKNVIKILYGDLPDETKNTIMENAKNILSFNYSKFKEWATKITKKNALIVITQMSDEDITTLFTKVDDNIYKNIFNPIINYIKKLEIEQISRDTKINDLNNILNNRIIKDKYNTIYTNIGQNNHTKYNLINTIVKDLSSSLYSNALQYMKENLTLEEQTLVIFLMSGENIKTLFTRVDNYIYENILIPIYQYIFNSPNSLVEKQNEKEKEEQNKEQLVIPDITDIGMDKIEKNVSTRFYLETDKKGSIDELQNAVQDIQKFEKTFNEKYTQSYFIMERLFFSYSRLTDEDKAKFIKLANETKNLKIKEIVLYMINQISKYNKGL
jgi:hypothetical protein